MQRADVMSDAGRDARRESRRRDDPVVPHASVLVDQDVEEHGSRRGGPGAWGEKRGSSGLSMRTGGTRPGAPSSTSEPAATGGSGGSAAADGAWDSRIAGNGGP